MLGGCVVLSGCVSVRPPELVPPDRVAQTSLVLDADGRTVAALHGPEDRTAVRLTEVSRWMRLAVVDTEDARFWRHGGVDWLAVARAAARDLAPVELTVAVDDQGAGGLGVTLVPGVLGQPEGAARRLLDQAGLGAEVLAGCDTDPARAAAGPGRVWRSGPAPGAQAPLGSRVRLWVNPPGCPPSATTTTSAGEG